MNHGNIRTEIGLAQGVPESPVLFGLFTADLPQVFKGMGAELAGKKIPLIMYADDMALVSNCPEELQTMINKLCNYLASNKLSLNAAKTKVMTFFKGRLPNIAKRDYYADNVKLEKVSESEYLGVILTPQ